MSEGSFPESPVQSGDVAQLVRALPCHGRGRGFEPRRPRHKPDGTLGFMAVIVSFIESPRVLKGAVS